MRSRLPAALVGLVSVALALAVAELVAAVVDGVPSLVTSVGSLIVPITPPAVESWAIRTFGTDDKAVLAAGTVLITLAVGALAGARGLADRPTAVALYASFTAIGLFAGVMQPLVSLPLTVLVTVGVSLLGWALLRRGWALIEAGADVPGLPGEVAGGDPTNPGVVRRQFLALVGGAGAVAVAAVAGARRLAPSASSATSANLTLPAPRRDLPPVSPAASFDVSGLTPVIVPTEEFYRIDTALSVPRIDVEKWQLRIRGMVDRELTLTWDDLLERSFVERDVTISCVSNEVGGGLVGNARWLGTSLRDLLAEAGVRTGATQIVGRSVDGWTAGFPTEVAMDGREALLAIGMNGEPLTPKHGFPARLIVPGLYGYVSATKWLTELELTTWEGFDAFWVPRGWSKEGPVKTQSRIDVPRPGARVVPGSTTVAGVAWAPTRGIDAVEVRLDDGPWQQAELSDPLSQDAWVQWRTSIDVPAGDHRLQVRATDGTGRTQGEARVDPRPDGAEGWHSIRVRA